MILQVFPPDKSFRMAYTNIGYITLGTSKDTSEFVCDNLLRVWTQHLQYRYPHAHTMMILCDGEGDQMPALIIL
jgi:hypothetical protein